ncbi:MAG: conjugal transfer protein TrbD [Burkholderiaceae bacterium]
MHRSTLRPFMFLGAERELGLLGMLLCFTVGFSSIFSKSLAVLVVSVILWMLLIAGLRALAKVDPQMSAVYRRHVQQQRLYVSHSRPFRGQ